MSDLYGDDILLWSAPQAELLRRHTADERANDGAIDWPRSIAEGGHSNVAERSADD
jgi:hypothetical protein